MADTHHPLLYKRGIFTQGVVPIKRPVKGAFSSRPVGGRTAVPPTGTSADCWQTTWRTEQGRMFWHPHGIESGGLKQWLARGGRWPFQWQVDRAPTHTHTHTQAAATLLLMSKLRRKLRLARSAPL